MWISPSSRLWLALTASVTMLDGCKQEEAKQLSVQNAFAPATPHPHVGATYFDLRNATDQPDRLLSVTGTVAEMIEIHETIDENGVAKMVAHPEGVAIPAGKTVRFAPGGKHVMLMGMARPLEVGQRFTLELTFERAGKRRVTVPVKRGDF